MDDEVVLIEEKGNAGGEERLIFVEPADFRETYLRRGLRVTTVYAKPPN